MATPAFVQLLLSGSSKTSGTSLALSGSVTLTIGNTIFLAFSCDDGGSAYAVVDNLGNIYRRLHELTNVGHVKTQLWTARVVIPGVLTTQTISWTTSVTAKAAVSGEFAGAINAIRLLDGEALDASSSRAVISRFCSKDDLWIGACGVEDDVALVPSGGQPLEPPLSVGSAGTTGASSASNISVSLIYFIPSNDNTANECQLAGATDASSIQSCASVGAVYALRRAFRMKTRPAPFKPGSPRYRGFS